ncbi:PadR family transcriptional regulator [Rhodopila sp.]|uniref:PadR family transcriptional regulator n=1 Tax=Rhodopila sp. TaxID=2480087 RepID=UPI003D0FD9F9
MIVDKPAHGYDLIKTLEDRMGGGYSPSPGVTYPTLTMLEEQGFADVTAYGGKKLYRATEDGVAYLRANQTTVDAIQARVDAVAKERNAGPPASILRAVENLRTAPRLRLAAGPIAADRVAGVAAAIDATAAEAERS